MPSTVFVHPTAQPAVSAEVAALVTELDRARTEAVEARADKARFLAVMNHEFRTPMNGVLGVAELLRRQPLSGQGHAFLDTLIESAETLQRLVEDALDLARGDACELTITPEPVQPTALLETVESGWSGAFAERGAGLMASFEGDPDLGVAADPFRLKQVLDAFVDHGLHRQRDGGLVELRLSIAAVGGSVHLGARTRDRGAPSGAATLARVFEPFAGDDGAGFAGRGLRLALARRVAEAMGGAVWAEANAGDGMTLGFDVRLPRAEAAEAARPSAFAGRSPRVLIVDDNATNRMVAAAFCEMAGCVCEMAEDGVEAVAAAQARAFDVILMDIKMPRLDGVSATRAIRALPGDAGALPIIALTANADPDADRAYRLAGMQETVEKPIKPERLLAALARALESGRPETLSAAA